MQSIVMLSVIYAECHIQALYILYHYGECHYAKCHYVEFYRSFKFGFIIKGETFISSLFKYECRK